MSGHHVGMPGGRRHAPLRPVAFLLLVLAALGAGVAPLAASAGAQVEDPAPLGPTTTTVADPPGATSTTLPDVPDDPSEVAPPAPDPDLPPLPPAPPTPGLIDGRDGAGRVQGPSDLLLAVPLTSGSYDAAESIRRNALGDRDEAREALVDLDAEIARLRARVEELAAAEAAARQRRDEVADALDAVLGDLREIAVARYVTDGVALEELQADLALAGMERRRVAATMADEAISTSSERAHGLEARLEVLDDALAEVIAELRTVRDDLRTDERRRPELVAALTEATAAVDFANATVGRERSTALVAGSDINFTALDAYWRGAATMRVLQPECRVDWWVLAGIGRSESRHGTYRGAVPNADGSPLTPIIGIPLDGTNNTRVIRDTDGGRLDGDPVFDRAVGPMQFIPSTWARWGADGSGDGIADPQNFYDATLAAARYLCAGGRVLDNDAGLMAGYLSYNRSLSYMQTVLGWARAYQLLPVPSVLG